jgi:5-hydroxyisourate hydrolase-like protein (transthyretin family)
MNSLSKAAFLAPLFALAVIANAETLKVQVFNGTTGKPVANEHVNIFLGKDSGDLASNRNIGEFNTDADGIFTVSQFAAETHSFTVYVNWHKPCAKNLTTFSLQEIFSKGVVSENSCRSKLERSVTPGTLILFVRDETFFEKMAH